MWGYSGVGSKQHILKTCNKSLFFLFKFSSVIALSVRAHTVHDCICFKNSLDSFESVYTLTISTCFLSKLDCFSTYEGSFITHLLVYCSIKNVKDIFLTLAFCLCAMFFLYFLFCLCMYEYIEYFIYVKKR